MLRGIGLVVLTLGCGRVRFDDVPRSDASGLDADAGCTGLCAPVPGRYRSVGPGRSTPLATGAARTLAIEGRVATFAGPLPDDIGVGDVLQYDSNGDDVVDALAFIDGRLDAMTYTVGDALGGVPLPTTDDRDWTLYRAYTSLEDVGNETPNPSIALPFDVWTGVPDLTAVPLPYHVACYADAPDVGRPFFDRWVTSATSYLRILTPSRPFEVGASQRHQGAWTTTRYHLVTPPATNDLALRFRGMVARVEGLQILSDTDGNSGDLPYGVAFGEMAAGMTGHVSDSILRSSGVTTTGAFARGVIFTSIEAGARLYVWNTVIYDFGGTAAARGIELTGFGSTAYLYNNTIARTFPAILTNDPTDSLVVFNNVAITCTSYCIDSAGPITGSNNAGNDFDVYGVGAVLPTDAILDYFVADTDFHVKPAASALVGAGRDLSTDANLPFATDIDGAIRTTPWDIGADQAP